MANLQIKNVPEDVHAELKRRAALEHMTVRDYVLRLIERDQMRMSGQEWLEQLHTREPVLGGPPAADLLEEAREESLSWMDRDDLAAEERARYDRG